VGLLITIEGLDGAGKSTLAAALAREIETRGERVELMREPGGVETSERIRSLIADPALEISARAEALLFAAARAQLVSERIEPLLADGTIVLLDRFVDSSLAYQGAGRALGLDAVRSINDFATGALVADRTLLLAISPDGGRARLEQRAPERDRLEREDAAFFSAIALAYDELARSEPQRIRRIDASQAPERVLADAVEEIADLLAPARRAAVGG
jgi:dTMP kinase